MPVKYFIRSGFNKLLIPIFVFVLLSVIGFSVESNYFSIDNSVYASNNIGAGLVVFNDSGDNLEFLIPSPPDSNDTTISDSGFVNFFADSTLADSLLADSLLADSLIIDPQKIDSTARLQHFKYNRKEKAYTEFNPPKRSAFFARPSQSFYTRTVELDSTKQYVLIKEKYGNQESKIFLKIPVETFIKLKLEAINKENWEELVYQYELKALNKDLSQLLSDITNIQIPLPSSSFLSIFGPPEINLRISGAVDIHGAWRSETTEGITSSRLGNTRNEPDFKQQVQINVAGTIGDKLTINADWNTERTFEYENQLKLHYKGYEDEIIQSIEAGNVSLQTSPLVGGSEALFGVKAQFQMGPLSLTALASQKKGEVKEVSVSGGSTTQQFEKHAYEYSQNHYFIDSVYADPIGNIFNNYYASANPTIDPTKTVIELEVWKTAQGYKDPQRERTANAFIDLKAKGAGPYTAADDGLRSGDILSNPARSVIRGRFIRLEEDIDYIYNQYTGVISFTSQIQNDDQIAVAFRQENNAIGVADDDIYYGEFLKDVAQDTSQVILLKLVKPKNLQPSFKLAWSLQLKNIYPVGGRDVKKEGFIFDIKYNEPGGEPLSELQGKKLLEAFGLDKTDDASGPNPDGAFDFVPPRTIIPKTGEIIFPTLQPFGRDFPADLDSTKKYQAVYDTTVTFARQATELDRFVMVGEYSASVTSTYSIGFNVVENSVKVLLNGNELRAGSDYSVDYNIGQVIIRNDAALVPGADLRITYEQNDLFALASKTLIGLRGLYEFSKDTKLGFSFLNLNQQTLSDKVRIGEEPLNNSIYGLDFQTRHDLPFLTDGLNNLISTSAPSSISLRGEFAYINPDPNTKKSTVESDNSESIAYIDDFEGAKRTIPVGMSDRSWKDISVPTEMDIIGNPETDKNLLMNNKGKSFWYNISPSNVRVQDIYGDRKSVAREDEQITVLDYVFRPNEPGTYNNTPDLTTTLSNNWGGIMKGLSSTASNLVEENIQFIEFWVEVTDENSISTDTKLYIDLGQISEDVIPNNTLSTEDKDPPNDIEEPEEDTGIDGLFDVDEPGYDPTTNPDPNHDNFSFTLTNSDDPNNYVGINGTEGNREFRNAGIKLPDTEDLNRNFSLDKVNSFFRYEVSLDTSSTNEFISGGGEGSKWFLYRVPLKDWKEEIGQPQFTVVENMRFWVGGVDHDVHLRFAEINLVGNQWQKVLNTEVTEEDSILTIGTINVEDNPSYFSPPGILRERDRSKPDQEVFKNEQSLELILTDLPNGKSREAVKYLYRPLDVFDYKEMKFFIHGDEFDGPTSSVSYYVDETNYGSEVYFRFGTDTANFYEYRQPVRAGWNEVKIIFDQLTSIKEGRTIEQEKEVITREVVGEPGRTFGVKGRPTLTSVKFFLVGILNPIQAADSLFGTPVSGNIWINELRVLQAEDTPGWAYSASSTVTFADLLTVNANISQTDPYFHRLADRFGSRVDRSNWGVSLDLDVLKLAPINMEGSNLKVNYSRNESVSKPLFQPGTDIFVDSAAAQRERRLIDEEGKTPEEAKREAQELRTVAQTLSVKETWSLSNIKLKIPSNKWYFRDTFNSLTFGFNYNQTTSRNPTVSKSTSWIWNASAKYSINFSKDYFIYPANIPVLGWLFSIFDDYRNVKVYYTPQTFSVNLAAKRNRSFSLNRIGGSTPNIQRDFTANRSVQFNWNFTDGGVINPSLNYSLDIASSLAYLLTTEDEIERNSSAIFGDIFEGQFFGKDNNYRQTVDFKLNPKLPSLWDINRYFTLTAGYNVGYNWRFNFQQDTLGRSSQFTNSIRAGLTLRWKALTAPLFKDEPQTNTRQPSTRSNRRSGGRTDRDLDNEIRRTNTPDTSDSLDIDLDDEEVEEDTADTGPSTIAKLLNVMKMGAQWLFFDYDQFSINFSQQNTVANSGLKFEGTGLNNFWGFKQSDNNGPGRLYQLGLSNNPGARAPNGNLSDNFSQKNSLDFKTSRPLWEGAQIDLNWNVSWGINKTSTIRTDADGGVTITNIASSRNINRSFLSFPDALFLSSFGSGIKKVNELYDPDSEDPNKSLSDAFLQGFESAPLISKLPFLKDFSKFIPRPNWRVNWSGLEKIGLFKNFTKRVSLNHAYNSDYSEGLKISPDGREEIQKQTVSYGFAPLVGLNLTFNDMWGGNLTGSIKYSTKTSYDLGVSTRNISESFQKDINFTASFSKSGFEIPLFGVSLKNDIEISLSYTSGRNSIVIFEMDDFVEDGKPQDGTTRTTIEPRIKYVISSKVTLSLFYKSTTVVPEGAARIPETSTSEAGLDVHIAIQ